MTKRSNTTGGPKQRQRTQEDAARRAAYLSRAERDRLYQRYMLIAIGILGGIIALMVLIAVVNDALIVPTQALTTVNGEEIKVDDYRDRVQFERFRLAEQIRTFYNSARESGQDRVEAQRTTLQVFRSQQGAGTVDLLLPSNSDFFGQQILTTMEQELILAQRAREFGITVDDEKVQAEVDDLMSLYTGRSLVTTPSPTPSSTPTETREPLVTFTPSPSPTETLEPSETPIPTLEIEGCGGEDQDPCPTVTPAPTLPPTETPTVTPEPSLTPTPLTESEAAATVVAFRNEFFDQGKDRSGLNEEAIRQVFYYRALSEAVRDYVTSDTEQFADYYVEPLEIWVDARHILVAFPQDEQSGQPIEPPPGDDNEAYRQAALILEALRAGEPFAALAVAQSDDPGSGSRGGVLGWASSANYVAGFKEAVETLPLGEISVPVRSQFGYHIIQVLDRETREIAETTLTNSRQEAYGRWIQSETALAEIQRRENWNSFTPSNPDYNTLLGDILPREQGGRIPDPE